MVGGGSGGCATAAKFSRKLGTGKVGSRPRFLLDDWISFQNFQLKLYISVWFCCLKNHLVNFKIQSKINEFLNIYKKIEIDREDPAWWLLLGLSPSLSLLLNLLVQRVDSLNETFVYRQSWVLKLIVLCDFLTNHFP